MSYYRFIFFWAFFISIINAQNCDLIFQNNSTDKNYWYGYALSELSRKSKISTISQTVLNTSVANLSSSIYSNISSNFTTEISEEFDGNNSLIKDKSNLLINLSSNLSGLEFEIISQGKCENKYYVLTRLNKEKFTSKQKQSLIATVNQYNSNSFQFLYLMDYLNFLDDIYRKLVGNYYFLSNPKIDKELNVSGIINEIRKEYFNSLSSISPSYTFLLPYSKIDSRSNHLEISFNTQSQNVNSMKVARGTVYIERFGNKQLFNFSSSDKIILPIDEQIRSVNNVNLLITINYIDLLSNHMLVENFQNINPEFKYTIKPENLKINFDSNIAEHKDGISNVFDAVLSAKVGANINNNDFALFSLKFDALSTNKKFNDSVGIYAYSFDDIEVSFINQLNGEIIFNENIKSIKGISFIDYNNALENLYKKIKIEAVLISNKISNFLKENYEI